MLVDEQGRESSPTEVALRCRRLVRLLQEHGVTREDRVVLSAHNTGDFALTLFALMHLGVSIGLVDRQLSQDECAKLLADSGARWFVSDHDQLGPAFDRVRINWIGLGDLAAATPDSPGTEDPDADPAFDAWAERGDGLIVWTSGSSGPPKGIVRSGAAVLRNIERSQERMGYVRSDVLLPLLPFTHQYGLSVLLLWWRSGCTLLTMPGRRVDTAMEAVAARGVTVVDAVPAAYDTLLRIMRSRSAPAGLDSVRMWCVGGEPLRDDLRQRFLERVGKPLLDGYGSSEAGNIALAAASAPQDCGPPLDGVHVEVVGSDGAPLPAGEVGEIVVRTPDIMSGLLEPGGRVRPIDRPVFHTSDVGRLDESGNLRVFGRRSAVHRFGHTMYPDAIAHKASACGVPIRVVPVEDAKRGTQLVFLVADPAEQPGPHWRGIIGRFVAEYEQPNRIVVLGEFPTNNNGKVDLRALEDLAASAVALEGVKGVLPVDRTGAGASVQEAGRIPFADRLGRLAELVELLRTRRSEVLALLTEVSNHKTAYGEIDASIAALEGAEAEVAHQAPPAINQLGVLMPSNIPLYSYIMYLVVPSLYAQRVVFRPSRRIEDLTRKLHELLSGAHHLPLVLDDSEQREFLEGEGAKSDALVFTGTYKNAEKIRASLRQDQLFIYFGQGVNPFVVGRDADIPKAVDGLLRARLLNSGQDCFGPDVVFVHTSISARFCNLLCRRTHNLRCGNYDDPAADYGRMFYLDAFDAALECLRKDREHLAAGGAVSFEDDHISPTVLIRPADTKVTPPELFAPIFNVVPFTSEDWLHTMVDHPYFEERAMAATVYGDMPDTVELLRRRHTVSVNETLIDIDNGNVPFGGTGIRANYAAIGRKRHAQPLLLSKAIAEHLSTSHPSTSEPAVERGA